MRQSFQGSVHGAGLAAVLLLLAIPGCGGGSGGGTAATGAGSGGVATLATAPSFTLNDLSGTPVALEDIDAAVRIVDFWATWCAPCREEVPMYKALHSEYRPEQLRIVALSMDDEGDRVVRPFVDEHGIEYTNLLATEDIAEAYGVVGLPATFILDRDGKIVKQFVGPKPKRVLVALIDEILERPS